jgi:hypothetical protein
VMTQAEADAFIATLPWNRPSKLGL